MISEFGSHIKGLRHFGRAWEEAAGRTERS